MLVEQRAEKLPSSSAPLRHRFRARPEVGGDWRQAQTKSHPVSARSSATTSGPGAKSAHHLGYQQQPSRSFSALATRRR